MQRAKVYSDSAIVIDKEIGDLNTLYYCYQHLSEIQSLMGDNKGALESYKNYSATKDSVFNMEKDKKITQTAMQYEFDKKEAANKAEQDKKDAVASAEIKRQKLIKNSTMGGVGIVGIFSFFLLRSFNRRKKIAFDKTVSEVEMKALRSQMNPHFIFNSLHSINKFMMDNEKENASEYLSKFSKLMRLILENSREQGVPVEKDLSALELYLQLEKLRFQNKFDYSISVAENIDKENTLIQPMMLQPFVENSIVHGIQNKEGQGKISVSISRDGEMIKCIVEDNGIGREESMSISSTQKENKSLAMSITQERISILNQIKKAKAALNIFDLKDAANNASGLRVELLLPLEVAF